MFYIPKLITLIKKNFDYITSIFAVFSKFSLGIIALPIILKQLNSIDYGIWIFFLSYGSIGSLIDFGFSVVFTRHLGYHINGISESKTILTTGVKEANLGLVSLLVSIMKRFYIRAAVLLFFLSIIFFYHLKINLLVGYNSDQILVYISYFVYVSSVLINMYFLYTECILNATGMIIQLKITNILSSLFYLFFVYIFLLNNYGLLGLSFCQLMYTCINRVLYYILLRKFRNNHYEDIGLNTEQNNIFKSISKVAIKTGLTNLGGFLVNKVSFYLVSFYFSVEVLGSYGLTLNLLSIMTLVSNTYFQAKLPKLILYNLNKELFLQKRHYLNALILQIIIFLSGGLFLFFFNSHLSGIINSNSLVLDRNFLYILILMTFLESHLVLCANFITLDDEVPFLKASLFTGFFVLLLSFFLIKYFPGIGLYCVILPPFIGQLLYQFWKWPLYFYQKFDFDLNIFKGGSA